MSSGTTKNHENGGAKATADEKENGPKIASQSIISFGFCCHAAMGQGTVGASQVGLSQTPQLERLKYNQKFDDKTSRRDDDDCLNNYPNHALIP